MSHGSAAETKYRFVEFTGWGISHGGKDLPFVIFAHAAKSFSPPPYYDRNPACQPWGLETIQRSGARAANGAKSGTLASRKDCGMRKAHPAAMG